MASRLPDLILLMICAHAVYTDLKYRKIKNYATFPAMILGLILAWQLQGSEGLKSSVIGLGLGWGFLIVIYLLGGIGAGDVKLMMAIGALRGGDFVLNAFLFFCVYAMVGALYMIFRVPQNRRQILAFGRSALLKIKPDLSGITQEKFPFAVPIALGVVTAWVLFYLQVNFRLW